ncbi:MAG TPA: arginyl aminopeptidase, partial [Ohtaekwangia sp.]
MKKYILVALALIVAGSNLFAQDVVAKKYGDLITPEDLKENLSILASDAMEGRETGKRGQKMAAAFIKAHFEELGLSGPVDGGYYQTVELYATAPGEIYIKAGQSRFNNLESIAYYGNADSGGEVSVPVVFAGKGRKEDFDQLSVEGKAIVVLLNSDDDARGVALLARDRKAKIVFICYSDSKEFEELVQQFKSRSGQS